MELLDKCQSMMIKKPVLELLSLQTVFSVFALNPSAVFWWQFILLVQQADFSGSLVSQEDIQVMHACAKISWVAQKMHPIIFALLMDSCANEARSYVTGQYQNLIPYRSKI